MRVKSIFMLLGASLLFSASLVTATTCPTANEVVANGKIVIPNGWTDLYSLAGRPVKKGYGLYSVNIPVEKGNGNFKVACLYANKDSAPPSLVLTKVFDLPKEPKGGHWKQEKFKGKLYRYNCEKGAFIIPAGYCPWENA